jgi:hypothetical protein
LASIGDKLGEKDPKPLRAVLRGIWWASGGRKGGNTESPFRPPDKNKDILPRGKKSYLRKLKMLLK